MAKIIIIGPAHPLRGGLATFDHRLAKAFQAQEHDCSIWSFSLQYPSFLFPGSSQFTDEPAPQGLIIHSRINSINPLNWIRVGNAIAKEQPDIIVVRYWLPFMGPALGTILRRIRKKSRAKILCIADNIQPHEKRPGDERFTRYFTRACDGFITMSEKVRSDLVRYSQKQALLVRHPLYDNFGSILSKSEARQHLNIPQDQKIILFFGFIRKYKGLDLLLDALKIVTDRALQNQHPPPHLLIAGEFYEDEKGYMDQIQRLNLAPFIHVHTHFIPDRDVKYYLCAADVLVQPYRNATQSGVTPLAYHFEKPMIVTNVGGLPDLVPVMKCGLVVDPEPSALAMAIDQFYELGENHFIPHLRTEKSKYSWDHLVDALLTLAEKTTTNDS